MALRKSVSDRSLAGNVEQSSSAGTMAVLVYRGAFQSTNC
jgi:hypothetical protein